MNFKWGGGGGGGSFYLVSAYRVFRIKKSVRKDCTLFMYIFKGTDNVGTYAFLNEVVSIADLVAYRNFVNLVSSRKQPWGGGAQALHTRARMNVFNCIHSLIVFILETEGGARAP